MIVSKVIVADRPPEQDPELLYSHTLKPDEIVVSNKVITNLTISASGLIKVRLYKNDIVLATLFNTNQNLNIHYPHLIEIEPGERLSMSVVSQDSAIGFNSYIGFEVN
jgi:hypothetical protein